MIHAGAEPELGYSGSLVADARPVIAQLDSDSESTNINSVVTYANLPAPPCQVWNELMFYEQMDRKPSLLLRLLLPIPVSTDGRGSKGGDLVNCRYVDGHLIKRLTNVRQSQSYAFNVVEQNLRVGRGIKLIGGSFQLRELPRTGTELTLETRYTSPHLPRWLWKTVEAAACHLFHRCIVGAIRDKISWSQPGKSS